MTGPTAPIPPPPWSVRGHARLAAAHAWSVFHPLPALYCAPGLLAALVAGLALDQPGAALLGAAGAFSAGFGAFHRLTRLRAAPMLLATLCMSLSTAAGTVASGREGWDAALVAVAALSLGLAGPFGTAFWWVLLQGGIFLIISGAHPGGWGDGGTRALIVLAGGVGQTALVSLLRRLAPRGFPELTGPNVIGSPADAAAWLAQARSVLAPGAPDLVYAVALAAAAGAAILASRQLALPNGYWAAMTVILVLRRTGVETLTRGVQRVAGTLVGAAAATLLVALLRPGAPELVALITAAAWCAYATQWVNYGTFSLSVTSYVAFLLALLGAPATQTAVHRVDATLLGAGIAAVALVGLVAARSAAERLRRPGRG